MNFFSIKWKISISFVVLSLGFVGAYVYLAKQVFETDKLSYVFETQQKQAENLAVLFTKSLERALLDARTVTLGYDKAQSKLSPEAQQFFQKDAMVDAIELRLISQHQAFYSLEKTPGLLKQTEKLGDLAPVDGKPHLTFWKEGWFILTVREPAGDKDVLQTRVIWQVKDFLEDGVEGQTLSLVEKNRVLMISTESDLKPSDVEDFLINNRNEIPEGTSVRPVRDRDHLVSVAGIPYSDLSIQAFLGEDKAMSALKVLYRRSVVFLLFSTFATIFIALILSFGLTRNINSLTIAAQRLGRGDFSSPPEPKTRDEVGVLAKAFQRMTFEIQRLLRDTADKARMESELKTARLVQDSLFPASANAEFKNIKLSGFYATSSECGGDWWYYYVRGDELYVMVADATGHGTPAALVTSAARSLFSYVERSDLPLKEIASHWNEAIAVCSKQKVFMTAMLAKINVVTGLGSYINAGHEPAVLLKREGDKHVGDFMLGVQNSTLGERDTREWNEGQFVVNPGDRFIMFTDGLTSFRSKEGKSFGEKRFVKVLEKLSSENKNLADYVAKVFKFFDDFGGNQTLPDDVTFVIIENKQI